MRKPLFNISGLLFSIGNRSTNHVFVKAVSWTPFFSLFFWIVSKMVVLGTSSKSDGCQNAPQYCQSGTNKALANLPCVSLGPFLEQPCARETAWSAPGHIFHDCWRVLNLPGLMLTFFRWLLASLLILNSGIRTNRHTPETMQTPAEIVQETSEEEN